VCSECIQCFTWLELHCSAVFEHVCQDQSDRLLELALLALPMMPSPIKPTDSAIALMTTADMNMHKQCQECQVKGRHSWWSVPVTPRQRALFAALVANYSYRSGFPLGSSMASPLAKIIAQIAVTSASIVSRAFVSAYSQAVQSEYCPNTYSDRSCS
jgi:hypothetical protein